MDVDHARRPQPQPAKLKYYAANRDQPRSIYENGRQYYLNFRFKF